MLWLRSEDPKLIIRVITFELTQHVRPRYLNVTDRRTDGQLTIAITALALRAHRGVKTGDDGLRSWAYGYWRINEQMEL